jgi:hypothetical protein
MTVAEAWVGSSAGIGAGHPRGGSRRSFHAYGLHVQSDFVLPGVDVDWQPRSPTPELRLWRQDRARLLSSWSGRASGTTPWRGRQGDGLDLSMERGADGDVLFDHGGVAHFLLSGDGLDLDCSITGDVLASQRVLLGKVIPSISVMRGYEALHAAALRTPAGVIGIMAASGGGKSTLTAALLGRGCELFADDQLTLSLRDGVVAAHPGTAHMNIAESHPPAIRPAALGASLARTGGEHWLAVRSHARDVSKVNLLCLLRRAPGLPLRGEVLPPNPLPLAPYMMGTDLGRARSSSRFLLYAELMSSTRLLSLTADMSHSPHELAGIIERAASTAAGERR